MEFDRSREAVSGNVSWPDFLDYQAQNQTLTGLAGYTGGGRTLNRPGLPPERVRGVMVTGNFFDVLGVPAALGRTFQPADMPAGAPPVVILSHAAWRTRFASDPAIVGRAIDLNGRPTTVIGVLPEDFQFTLRVDVLELPEVDSRHVATMEVTLWSLKELTNHRQEPGRSVAPRDRWPRNGGPTAVRGAPLPAVDRSVQPHARPRAPPGSKAALRPTPYSAPRYVQGADPRRRRRCHRRRGNARPGEAQRSTALPARGSSPCCEQWMMTPSRWRRRCAPRSFGSTCRNRRRY